MRVFTYYQFLHPQRHQAEREMLRIWQESWARFGWTPTCLSIDDAAEHPLYERFQARVSTFPTVNDHDYELACFVRHLAFATVADGESVFVDYDTLNLGWTPDAASQILDDDRQTAASLILNVTPAAFVATGPALTAFINACYHWDCRDYTHVSDQTVMKDIAVPSYDVTVETGRFDPPPTHALYHFQSGRCAGHKLEVMRAALNHLN